MTIVDEALSAIERTESARNFPKNTCAASRHAQQIGEALVLGETYPMLTEEPAHCGGSILGTVEALWKARTEIERLLAELRENDELRRRMERILSATAVALRGPEPLMTLYSWHDLPERAGRARRLLLLALYHHQGGSSTVGQPIRHFLEIGRHDHLTPEQVSQAKDAKARD